MIRRPIPISKERCCICSKKLDKSHRPLPVGFVGFHHLAIEGDKYKNQRRCSSCAKKKKKKIEEKVYFLIFQTKAHTFFIFFLNICYAGVIWNQPLKFSERDLPRLFFKKNKENDNFKNKKHKNIIYIIKIK